MAAIAGNHVVIALSPEGPYVAVVHLRQGSVQVRVGDQVEPGTQVAECGNSGNSTEPHVHVQVTDSIDWATARGVPLAFVGVGPGGTTGVPREGDVVAG
jgi:murein DD-endopeptidase MepM/ murein hydrolase activator NlpD